jgi:hypothetical protein
MIFTKKKIATVKEETPIILKDIYTWMSSEAIIEQFSTEELKIFTKDLNRIINTVNPAHQELPKVLEQMIINERPKNPHILDALRHINELTKAEIHFRSNR